MIWLSATQNGTSMVRLLNWHKIAVAISKSNSADGMQSIRVESQERERFHMGKCSTRRFDQQLLPMGGGFDFSKGQIPTNSPSKPGRG